MPQMSFYKNSSDWDIESRVWWRPRDLDESINVVTTDVETEVFNMIMFGELEQAKRFNRMIYRDLTN